MVSDKYSEDAEQTYGCSLIYIMTVCKVFPDLIVLIFKSLSVESHTFLCKSQEISSLGFLEKNKILPRSKSNCCIVMS